MLNYIWLFLIGIALCVGIGKDISDEVQNTYRNNVPLEVTFLSKQNPSSKSEAQEGFFLLSANQFNNFYGTSNQIDDIRQPASISIAPDGSGSCLIICSEQTPFRWQEMGASASGKGRLTGLITKTAFNEDRSQARLIVLLEPIRFVKMKAITQAALDFANTAVEIALGLIGIMALWLGLIKVAEEAGLVKILTKILAPVTKRLFPDVPSDHPAIGAIIMNTAANMLGLSNAATPMGLKAMEELNKLNPKIGTATNAMITFLAINTGGVILIPATAIAVRAAAGSANPGIIIGTSIVGAGCATITGIAVSKLLQRLPRYKKEISTETLKSK